MVDLLSSVQRAESRPGIPELRPGDTVRILSRALADSRRRAQPFQGTVIRLRGRGTSASVTVRRIASHGIGVEKTFLLNSPLVNRVEVLRHAHIRRARPYFLRKRRGKSARLREKRY